MNKRELIASISEAGSMSKSAAERALNSVLANMAEAMCNGEKVMISNFGSFKVIDRAPQRARDPQTGKEIMVPARKVIKFKAAKKLSEKVQ